jgi:hypothetical protein
MHLEDQVRAKRHPPSKLRGRSPAVRHSGSRRGKVLERQAPDLLRHCPPSRMRHLAPSGK